MANIWQKIAELLRLSRLEKRWQKVARILAIVVVFCTTYMLILPAITMESRTCCGLTEHVHRFSCYLDDTVLICGQTEHKHSDTCFIKSTDGNVTDGNVTDGNITSSVISEESTTVTKSQTEAQKESTTAADTLVSETTTVIETAVQTTDATKESEKTTAEAVNLTWEQQVAAYASSLSQEEFISVSFLSSEDRFRVLEISYVISMLPSADEFYEELDRLYSEDDVEGEEMYFLKIQNQVSFIYVNYQNLENLQSYVINSEKLFTLKEIFSNMSISTYVTGSTEPVTFNFINHTWNISSWDTSVITPIIVHGGSVSEKVGSAVNRYWYGVVVEYDETKGYYVSEVYESEGDSTTSNAKILALEATTSKGFVILVWSADNSATTAQKHALAQITQAEVGDLVEITMDPTTVSSSYKTSGYGTFNFKQYIEPEEPGVEVEEDLDYYTKTSDPSDSQIDDGGGKITSADSAVITTKTIDGTSEENVFDITLTVQTKTDVQTFISEPDMAVVIVMDISNTMNSIFTDDTMSRYDAAVTAASEFIEQFAENTSGLSQIGFVAFNTHAHEIFSLQPCSTATQANSLITEMSTETDAIISASGYGSARTRYTNVEGGLKRGYDMLKKSGNANQYVILLTDGFPTTYLVDNSPDSTNYNGYEPYTSSGTIGTDGVFYDSVLKTYCKYGTSYSDKASIKAREMADSIEASGGKIFSIGVDVAGQTVQQHINNSDSSNSIVDRTGTTYEIGGANDLNAYKNWLGNSVGSGYYYDSTDQAGITKAFDEIFAKIRELNEQSTKTIWTATDPLPVHDESSQVVEFIHFYDKDGNIVGPPDPETIAPAENEQHIEGGENWATHSDNTIFWDLKKSGYSTTTEGSVTTYYYKLKYRVRLVNEVNVPPFVEGQPYATNGDASLEYRTIVTTNGVQEASDLKEVGFSKPAVHGYVAGFSFLKYGSLKSPLEGAEFTLYHDEGCKLCHGDETAVPDNTAHDVMYESTHVEHSIGPYVAVSDVEGVVSFEYIPSGHAYTMEETVVPKDYLYSGSTYSVVVAYDELTVTETCHDGTIKVWDFGEDNIVYNYGPLLPETGGIGTHYLYITGGMLMFLSVVFLLCKYKSTRKRRSDFSGA